jgi:hypothetical protein
VMLCFSVLKAFSGRNRKSRSMSSFLKLSSGMKGMIEKKKMRLGREERKNLKLMEDARVPNAPLLIPWKNIINISLDATLEVSVDGETELVFFLIYRQGAIF